ncbi:MAG: hypothetical protein AAF492_05750, partial [Verrucomicrobiota bacterium]
MRRRVVGRFRQYAVCVVALQALGSMAGHADLRFSRHYTDDMVLQREKPVEIRGFADRAAEVSVTFADQSRKVEADAVGVWSVTLEPMAASTEGRELTCSSGGSNVVLTNVLVGDVFLFARQTTIDVSLGRDEIGRGAAAGFTESAMLRAMTIETIPAVLPQEELSQDACSGWSVLSKKLALNMNAAAFYMARDLSAKTDVPIGIIDLNLGHHFPIAWLSEEALKKTAKIYDARKTTVEGSIEAVDNMFEITAKMLAEFEDEEKRKEAASRRPDSVPHPRDDPRCPAAGYNAVLHPMRGLALKGLLLQLGNNYPYMLYERLVREGLHTSRAHLGQTYKDSYDVRKWGIYLEPITTPRIPREWRAYFGDDSLAIGWITPPGSDLVPSGRHHREMRELQRRTAETEKGVDLILAGTEHIPFSAQPAHEELLGARCLAWLKGAVYKEDGAVASGPLFERAEINDSKVHFSSFLPL